MSRREHLIELLRRHEPSDPLETRHHCAMLNLLRSDGDPFSRAHFHPGHVTASCFIVDDEWRLLLHHHRRLGRWLQMGGHLDAGESAVEAALREGREESGLTDLELVAAGIVDVDVHPIPPGRGEPGHAHYDIRFVARTRRPEAIARAADESNDIAWVSLADAPAMMNEEASSRVIRKIASFRARSS